MKKISIFIISFFSFFCGEPQQTVVNPLKSPMSVSALLYLLNQKPTLDQTNVKDMVDSYLSDAPSGLKGDFTNNTPAGAKCMTDGTTNCATCNINSNVNLTSSGSIVSPADVDWYCFNHAAGTDPTYFIITTERNDGFFQPYPTDTYLSLYNNTVSTGLACTNFLCGGTGFVTRDDDSGATNTDPTRTYSKITRNLAATTGVYYIRVGLTSDRPGSYRIRLERKQ